MHKQRQSKMMLVVLFIAIFASWWGVAVFTQTASQYATIQAPQQTASGAYDGSPLTIVHQQNGDNTTYSGNVPLRSSCDELNAGLATTGGNPLRVTIVLLVAEGPANCAQASQMQTTAPFSVSLSSTDHQTPVFAGVTVNGVIAPVTLIERP